MSERIRVLSVIGRFLEHSRVLYFSRGSNNPADGEFLIGSADMMYRNLLGRIETMAPIEGKREKERIWEILDVMLSDRRSSWEMQSDGTFVQYKPRTQAEHDGTHRRLMNLTKSRHAEESAAMAEAAAEAAVAEAEMKDENP